MKTTMSATRKACEDYVVSTKEVGRLEGLADAVKAAMDAYVDGVVSFLMDEDCAFSHREQKIMISAITEDTKQLSRFWEDTRYIAKHGFKYCDHDPICETEDI